MSFSDGMITDYTSTYFDFLLDDHPAPLLFIRLLAIHDITHPQNA
ncbi:hypothetical protein [Bacteroides thetaiotaomicron]